MKISRLMMLTTVLTLLAAAGAVAGPLKVYIMTGQSNMQGKARVETLPAMAADPVTQALHDKIVGGDGEPRVYENVHIAALSSHRGQEGTKNGPLTTGYGGGLGEGETAFGTELAFGITLYEHLKEPILIIKASWGGKSLHTDFRPPSAGPWELPEETIHWYTNAGRQDELADKLAEQREKCGVYYKKMMEHVRTVLADPGKYCSAYDSQEGYELAGIVWFQGFNDMIGPYPKLENGEKDYSEYSQLLARFIRDVRKDLRAPELPFVIGVLGIGGKTDGPFQKGQAAPAEMPELKGNVVAVLTGDYWDHKLAELDTRNNVARADGRGQRRADPEGKYKALQAKVIPLVEEQKKLTGRSTEVMQKREQLRDKIDSIIFTPEELKYYKQGRSNAAFHYLGSAKIYSRIGEAFAQALVHLKEN